MRLRRVWCAADAGLVINPDGARNQLEGGIVQAASMVLKEQVRMEGDGVTSLDWEGYPILRFSEVPEIDTEIIHAPDLPTLGMGECTFGPTAAAIGNAVAHALGTRIRDMPFTRERIEAALLRVRRMKQDTPSPQGEGSCFFLLLRLHQRTAAVGERAPCLIGRDRDDFLAVVIRVFRTRPPS